MQVTIKLATREGAAHVSGILAGFTPEERSEYLAFSRRITENLQHCLQN